MAEEQLPMRTASKIAQLSLTGLVVPLGLAVHLVGAPIGDLLPDGPGKAATVRVCGKCHSPERAASMHLKRSGWEDTIVKMLKLGAEGSDEELESILTYLSTNFGPETPGPVSINKADAADLEAALSLRRSQAKAIIEFRAQHGDFKSIDDLRNVPGLDFEKIQSKRNRLEL